MKSIDGVIWVGFLFFIGIFSINTLLSDITTSGVTLDEESTNLIVKYNIAYVNASRTQALNSSNSTGLPSYTGTDAEARESAESKGIIASFTDLWDVLTSFPGFMFASLPFVDDQVGGYLGNIFTLLLGILTMYNLIALYRAWKTGDTK